MPAPDYTKVPWVYAVQGASMLDWPGRTAAVLFLSGCDFACAYCHNPELRKAQPGTLALDAVVERLAARRDWVSSVVVTGGEPLLFPHLGELLGALRDAGLATAVNTNGSHPLVLSRLLAAGLLDRVNLDLKTPLAQYATRPGLRDAGKDVARSLALLLARSATVPAFEMECRTTLDRRYVGSAEEVATLVSFLGRTGHHLVLQGLQGDDLRAYAVPRDEAKAWCGLLPEELRPELRGFRF